MGEEPQVSVDLTSCGRLDLLKSLKKMPNYEDTPAPDRKFRFTSIPGTGSGSSSVRRNPFANSRSQLPASTPSVSATPRFQSSTQLSRDDIQNNFDEDSDLPLLPNASSNSRAIVDVDDDDDDDDDDQNVRFLFARKFVAGEGIQDESLASSPLQPRHNPSSPLTKRRKTTHRQAQGSIDVIADSSPPEERSDHYQSGDSESADSQSDLQEDLEGSTRLPAQDTSRFRLVAVEFDKPSPTAKSAFKPTFQDLRPATSPSSLLPQVFTPSRRKGNRDYEVGSNADLVRSWVLAISTQEARAETSAQDVRTLIHATRYSSGRFTVATDDTRRKWLLPDQQQKPGMASTASNEVNLQSSARIRIKGQATQWPLLAEGVGMENITVAAYWEPTPRG